MRAEARLRDVPWQALGGPAAGPASPADATAATLADATVTSPADATITSLAAALDAPLAAVLGGAAAERVLDRFLRDHRGLDRDGRRAAAEAIFGVGLWRRRLRCHLGGGAGTPRRLLALLLRDLAGLPGPEAAALTGLAPGDLPPPVAPPADLADRWSLPDWLARDLRRACGGDEGEAAALAEALDRPGPLFLRVNPLRCDAARAVARLAAEGVAARPGRLAPGCLEVEGRSAGLTALPALRDGWVEPQDEGSQLLALALGARAGEAVLDRCAGAGGKALALAGAVGPGGRVHACDADAGRLARLTARAARAGAERIVRVEGAAPPAGLLVDRALVDAPCSELGPLRRGPDQRWRLDPAGFAALPPLQAALLGSAADRVRPGGRLVYATCTFRREENEGVAEAFEAARPGWRRVRPDGPAEVIGPDLFLRTFPHRHGTDGFFAAAWERAG